MEQINKSDEVVLLFDTYSVESQNLYQSFQNIGVKVNAVVIEDDGFLPDGIVSIFGYFLGDFSKSAKSFGKPRYFNNLEIPEFWEIESSNISGKIMDYNKERARIFYAEPTNKRWIKLVDWLDENGVVRLCEHYNKYGALFCKTTFNRNGQKVSRNFFSAEGKEVIVENFVTGDIIVTMNGKDVILHNKQEFIRFFMRSAGMEQKRIFYNSLSFPFFASLDLPDNGGRDVLFWSEEIADEIPGNMQLILNRNALRTGTIYVQKCGVCEKLIELGASKDIVKELGYVYRFERENQGNPEVLICTNSDQVEKLAELVQGLPNLHFHVAALTEMSQKLHFFEKYKNVSLYPGVKTTVLDKLFEKCDFYFDINHESEIVDAVHRAFLNNMVIFGFSECIHNWSYIARKHIYRSEQADRMIADVKQVMSSAEKIEECLTAQRSDALAVNEKIFAEAINR